MESGSKRASIIISEPVRYMDKLDEFILIEILQRLPSIRSVTQCKLVSRHWNYLISCPHFRTRFLKDRRTKKEFSIILTQHRPTLSTHTLLSNGSKFQNFDCNNFAIAVLKSTPYNHTTLDLEILATYNELILCLHRYRRNPLSGIIMKFYVYNPLTKQHVALPPSRVLAHHTNNAVVGFLCRSGQSSFRVVHILRMYNGERVRMHIFSSEENKWTGYILGAVGETIVNYSCVTALPWNGLLCWVSYNNPKLIVCNPYSPANQHFHFITIPPNMGEAFSFGVGVFRGTLRLWRQHGGLFRVWELKDYNTEEWSLKHQVPMDMDRPGGIRAAAFDPNDEDVVYYPTSDSLISLNMRTRDSSPVKASLETKVNLHNMNLFMLAMPEGFPTPVTTLTESQDRGLETSKGKEA